MEPFTFHVSVVDDRANKNSPKPSIKQVDSFSLFPSTQSFESNRNQTISHSLQSSNSISNLKSQIINPPFSKHTNNSHTPLLNSPLRSFSQIALLASLTLFFSPFSSSFLSVSSSNTFLCGTFFFLLTLF